MSHAVSDALPDRRSPRRVRVVRGLLRALGVSYALLFSLVFLAINLAPDSAPDDRAILRMGAGLLLIWVVFGGLVQRRSRERFVRWAERLPLGRRTRFVVLCTGLALLEEAVTVSMSNLGPWLGAETEAAAITASRNYLEVVLLHSVIIFVPMYWGWAWLLARWRFAPAEVFLLYGLSGWLAETLSFGPQNLLMVGMWVYVYGLMVWLPAHTFPAARPARDPRWWTWPLAVVLPILAAIPAVPVVLLLQRVAGG